MRFNGSTAIYFYCIKFKNSLLLLFYFILLAESSACLITSHEVAGSIPGSSITLKRRLGLEQAPLSFVTKIG